jgi:hypothetical protein
MEWLHAVDQEDAVAFHRMLSDRDETLAELAAIIDRVHARALRELPWCGPLDDNPANVMRAADGRMVVADLFYADGPALYAAASADPGVVTSRIPEHERRFMTEIPLAASGPWDAAEREAMRLALAAAEPFRG